MQYTPLSELIRPQSFQTIFGQDHLVGKNGFLSRAIISKHYPSIVLWGPPGTGKTTIAQCYALASRLTTYSISGSDQNSKKVKEIIEKAIQAPLIHPFCILFIDEIHRWNKGQQDLLLPYVEKGTFILIGATTENPSFNMNPALLSRLTVLELYPLNELSLESIIQKIEEETKTQLTKEAKNSLIEGAHGDARYLINQLEMAVQYAKLYKKEILHIEDIIESSFHKKASHDKQGEMHYNLISVLHKSIRGSDVQAALYWLARMLSAHEDPLFILRRLIRMAVEDIGLADPQALVQATQALVAFTHLGLPEGELVIAQVVVYLALAPKSNRLYRASQEAKNLAEKTHHLPPPRAMLNPHYLLAKTLGYGKGYIYEPDTQEGYSGQNFFPELLNETPQFYTPKAIGFEKELKKRLEYFLSLKEKLKNARNH